MNTWGHADCSGTAVGAGCAHISGGDATCARRRCDQRDACGEAPVGSSIGGGHSRLGAPQSAATRQVWFSPGAGASQGSSPWRPGTDAEQSRRPGKRPGRPTLTKSWRHGRRAGCSPQPPGRGSNLRGVKMYRRMAVSRRPAPTGAELTMSRAPTGLARPGAAHEREVWEQPRRSRPAPPWARCPVRSLGWTRRDGPAPS